MAKKDKISKITKDGAPHDTGTMISQDEVIKERFLFPSEISWNLFTRFLKKHYDISPSILVDTLMVFVKYINQKKIFIENLEDCITNKDIIDHLKGSFALSDIEITERKGKDNVTKYSIIDLRKTDSGILKYYWGRDATVSEAIDFLTSVEAIYTFFYLIEHRFYYLEKQELRSILDIKFLKNIIPNHECLRINKISISSPGVWEFLGSLNPLSQIRELLKDIHERKKDIGYKNELEEKSMVLENEKRQIEIHKNEIELEILKTKLIQERIEMYKSIGLSEEAITEFILSMSSGPVRKLGKLQDNKLITVPELIKS